MKDEIKGAPIFEFIESESKMYTYTKMSQKPQGIYNHTF